MMLSMMTKDKAKLVFTQFQAQAILQWSRPVPEDLEYLNSIRDAFWVKSPLTGAYYLISKPDCFIYAIIHPNNRQITLLFKGLIRLDLGSWRIDFCQVMADRNHAITRGRDRKWRYLVIRPGRKADQPTLMDLMYMSDWNNNQPTSGAQDGS